jgi:carboxymethylenebutenolidase
MANGITTGWLEANVADGGRMNCYWAAPTGEPAEAAALLVFQEAFGVNAHIRDVTERLAREGYIALAPELFHRTAPGFDGSYDDFPAVMPHMQALTVERIQADIRAAFEALIAERGAVRERIGAIGFCMGGRVAFIANATVPLRAAVSYYGGRIAPLLPGMAPSQHAPLLMYWGGRDRHIGPEDRRSVADALTENQKEFAYVEFSSADHGFFCDRRPSYHPQAARESWALTLAFLHERMAHP